MRHGDSTNRSDGVDLSRLKLDFSPKLPRRLLAEGDGWKIIVDEWGVTKRLKREGMAVPQFLESSVKSREDFLCIKDRFDPADESRYPDGWERRVKEHLEKGDSAVGLFIVGLFGFGQSIMGLVEWLKAFIKTPNLVREMLDFWSDFVIKLTRRAMEVGVDYVDLWEDMAYRNGPMISPKLFSELMVPYYERLTHFFRSKGVSTIMVDSDGDINPLIPYFLKSGVNGFLPLEIRAGMNAVKLREMYGDKLILIGNLSFDAIAEGLDSIKREVDVKLPKLLAIGGYVAMCDHSIPPYIPYRNYSEFLRYLRKKGTYPL
jgi:uroporphyrinogen decarboxylase